MRNLLILIFTFIINAGISYGQSVSISPREISVSGPKNSNQPFSFKVSNNSFSEACEVRVSSKPTWVELSTQSVAISGNGSATFSGKVNLSISNASGTIYLEGRRAGGIWNNLGSISVKGTLTYAPLTAPTYLREDHVTANSISVKWNESTGGYQGVKHYKVYVDGREENGVHYSPSATIIGLKHSTIYTITVRAEDHSGKLSDYSSALKVTTKCGYTNVYVENEDLNKKGPNASFVIGALQRVILTSGFHYKAENSRSMRVAILTCPTPRAAMADYDFEEDIEVQNNDLPREKESEVSTMVLEALPVPNLVLSPLPVKNILSVRLDSGIDLIKELQLYNISGKLLQSKQPASDPEQFDIQSYSNGFYILRILYKDGKVESRKFVLSK